MQVATGNVNSGCWFVVFATSEHNTMFPNCIEDYVEYR